MLADAAADFTIIGDVAKHVCFVVVVVVVVVLLLIILLLVVVVVVVVVVLLPCALQLYASMWLSTSDHNFQRSMSRFEQRRRAQRSVIGIVNCKVCGSVGT